MELTYNKNIQDWKRFMELAARASEEGNEQAMDEYMKQANIAYQAYKEEMDMQMQMESLSFGFMNYIIEENYERLMSDDKRKNKGNMLAKYLKMVKEDKNLKNQYNLIESILRKNSSVSDENLAAYITSCIDIASKGINKSTLKESNKKVIDLVSKKKLLIKEDISDTLYNIFDNIDSLLKEEQTLDNVENRIKTISELTRLVKSYRNGESLNESIDKPKDLNEFYKKYNNILNEDEKQLVKSLLNSENGGKEAFESYKEECFNKINDVIKECKNQDDKEELEELKRNIENINYNEENLIESISKLLDVKDVLND